MNTNPATTPEQSDDKKSAGEALKDAVIKPYETKPDDEGPVGPFEHSGEVAGWTETEEKQETNDQGDQQ